MITEDTVLVLGAGVSKPYGYPTGFELIQIIYGQIISGAWDFLNYIGSERIDREKFANELIESQLPSIDTFLENRPEYVKIGKISIALALFDLEDTKNLIADEKRDEGVYQYIYQLMIERGSWKTFEQNRISFITFNYDRSLEQFFFVVLKATSGSEDEVIAEKIKKIQIIHVHGSLGPLPWQDVKGRSYKKINIEKDDRKIFAEIDSAKENIFIQSESHKSYSEFEKSHALLQSAKRIYFLGFGYHQDNLEKLDIQALQRIPKFRATHPDKESVMGNSYHLGNAKIESIQDLYGIYLPTRVDTDIEFIRDYARLD